MTSICFIGAGKINAKHAAVLRRLRPDLDLSIASRSAEKAEAFRARLGLRAAIGSSRMEDIPASTVFIGTPPNSHHALALAALGAGKHVIVEKPAFNTLAEFDEVAALARAKKLTLFVAENQHYDPLHRKMVDFCARRPAGTLYFFELLRIGRAKLSGWREAAAEMPLGAMHEGGVHWLRRFRELAAALDAAPVERVDASIPDFGAKPFERTMILRFAHRDRFVSTLHHSWDIPRRFSPLECSRIIAENYSIYFDGRGLGAAIFGAARWPKVLLPDFADMGGFKAMWVDFLAVLETGAAPSLRLEDVREDLAIIERAYADARAGR